MTTLTVSELYIHPVKSLAGYKVDHFKLDSTDPEYDRRWMVINAKGKFLTQRQNPKMCLINTRLDSGELTLSAANCQPHKVPVAQGDTTQVQVWHDFVAAQDCGDAVANWLSQFLGVSARLVYMPEHTNRRVDQDYALNNETVSFADGFPLLVVSQASLDLLNRKLDHSVRMDRFRPNIVIDGCEAHAEDDWKHIQIADQSLSLVKPCSRCIIPSIDPMTGVKQPHVTEVLNSYRRAGGKIYFGQNAVIGQQASSLKAMLSVGDPVTIRD